jgi:hypothetical protein
MKQIVPAALLLSFVAQAQGTNAPYASMAPLDRYLIADRNAEISLAKSAAPKAISDNADVMVLERQGYKTVAKGTNGFVCMVERSWTAPFGDPEFWNPKIRGPICFNPPAARTYLPITISRTQLALAGKSETQVRDAINAAFAKRELPTLEAGSMCYMLSKQGYLGDQAGHFHPHLMFWAERTQPESWGVGAPGSPIMGKEEIPGRLTIFIIPVGKWSDGTSDSHDYR